MLKNLLSNPVSRTFIALCIALAFVLGAFGVYVTSPDSFGVTDITFDTDMLFYFADDWSINYDYLSLSFAPGTLVIPSYHNGQLNSVLLIAPEDYPGSFTLKLPQDKRGDLPETITDNLDQALVMLDFNDYKSIIRDSGDTILLRANNIDVPERYIQRQLGNGRELLTSFEIFGFRNWLLPQNQTVLLRLWGQRTGSFSYYEDARVQLDGLDFQLDFKHPNLDKVYYPPAAYKVHVLLYMSLLAIASLSIISLVAGSLDNKHQEIKGEYNPLWVTMALASALLYAWLMSVFQANFLPSQFWMAALWFLPLCMVATWARQTRLGLDFFGISPRGLGVSVIASIVVGLFITLGSTFRLPTGVDLNLYIISSVLLASILREAFLRGFCQRILSHWLHPIAGYLLVSIVWALILVSPDLLSGTLSALPLVSALSKSLIIGFIYFRTNNIFAPGLLAALLELAPQILEF